MKWSNASICIFTAKNCCAKSSTVSPKRPPWVMGALRKQTFLASCISARLSQDQVVLLNHENRHHPTQSLRCDLRVIFGIVSRLMQFLHNLWIGTTLVLIFRCFGLVELQDGHHIQCEGGLTSGIVSPCCQRRGKLICPGRKPQTFPPGGSILWP